MRRSPASRAGRGLLAALGLLAAIAAAAAGPHAMRAAGRLLPSWRVVARLRVAGATAVAMAPGDRLAAVLVPSPKPAVVWVDPATGRPTGQVALSRPPTNAVFDATGRRLAVTYGNCGFGPVPCDRAAVTSLLAAGGGVVATVPTGSGSTALAAVPGGADVLVTADGAGTVDLVDSRDGRVLHTFAVGSGVLDRLAVDPARGEAAAANATAGTVTILDLRTGSVGAVANVSDEVGPMSFAAGLPYLFAGQGQGQAVDVVHVADGAVTAAARAAEDVGGLVYLPRTHVLAVASLTAQSVALFAVGGAGAPVLPSRPTRTVTIGPAAAGRVAALVPAARGSELLAAAQHGLGVLAPPRYTVVQRLLPSVLGGPPRAVASADGRRAIVLAGPFVDIVARGGGRP